MGCGISKDSEKVANSPTAVSPKILSPRKGLIQKLDSDDDADDILNSFNFITNEIDSIMCPSGMMPIACMTKDSFAVVDTELILSDQEKTNITLPVVACSVAKLGRFVCLGHIFMLFSNYFLTNDTSSFYHNIFVWLTSKQILLSTVLLLKMPLPYEQEMVKQMRSFGFNVETGNFDRSLDTYQLILLPSTIDLTEQQIQRLLEYSDKGGAICCCYVPSFDPTENDDFKINTFLSHYGLSYMYCSISNPNEQQYRIFMPDSFDEVRQKSLPFMIDKFRTLLNDDDLVVSTLDDFVTELRYMTILCAEGEYLAELMEILEICWHYLKRCSYRDEERKLLTPDLLQSIIIVLIIDINNHLPIDKLTIMPDCSIFPGLAHGIELKTHKVEATVTEQCLVSTGLWLPAGQHSNIILETDLEEGDELMVQIGAQSESLITEPVPWKRWPEVVTAFPITKGKTEVFSQFGGIVYLASTNFTKKKIDVIFNKFSKFPKYVEGKPDVYQKTKNIDVPWGEIHCKQIILTIPTTVLKKIEQSQLDDACKFFNRTLKSVAQYMQYPIKRQFRIVFDVQTPNNRPIAKYPIFLPIEFLDTLFFENDIPSKEIYQYFCVVATICLKEDYFDSMTEESLSQFVAAQMMKDYYNIDITSDEHKAEYPTNHLFSELWNVTNMVDEQAVQRIIHDSMDPDAPQFFSDEDRWTNFTKSLSELAQTNFAPAFEKLQRIPMNISTDVDQFPTYLSSQLEFQVSK